MNLNLTKQIDAHKVSQLKGMGKIRFIAPLERDFSNELIISIEDPDDDDAYLSLEITRNEATYIMKFISAFIDEKNTNIE